MAAELCQMVWGDGQHALRSSSQGDSEPHSEVEDG